MQRPKSTPLRAAVIGVIGIISCWALATPRYAGPDEPSHSVSSAALVRGHRMGQPVDDSLRAFEVPAMVGDPDPGCYAFSPDQPASCAGAPTNDTSMTQRVSTAWPYPIWAHLMPGLASFIPSPQWYLYLARLLNAAIPAALLVAALIRCRRSTSPWLVTGLLVGLTPIAWFSMGVVNPSAIVIAGGAALWTSILVPKLNRGDALLVAAWMAVLLPRRDGPLWATLIIILGCAATHQIPSDIWRRLGRTGKVLVLLSVPMPLLPIKMLDSRDRLSIVLALLTLALPIADAIARASRHSWAGRVPPAIIVGGAFAIAMMSLVTVNLLRTGGPDIALTWRIIDATGNHLRELFGMLGWLDTPPPESALLLWFVVLGGLASLALIPNPRQVAVAGGVLATGLVAAWVSLLGIGGLANTTWQGRYSVPFLIGVPMVLAAGIEVDPASERRVLLAFRGAVWLALNATFYAAMRRWGAGVDGSVYPWRWATWTSPLHPAVFVVLHAAASTMLLFASPTAMGGADRQAEIPAEIPADILCTS